MRTKTIRRHTIKFIQDILAPNLSLVFRILNDCVIYVFVLFSFSIRSLSETIDER